MNLHVLITQFQQLPANVQILIGSKSQSHLSFCVR